MDRWKGILTTNNINIIHEITHFIKLPQKAYREAQLIKSLSGWYDQFRYSDTFEGDTVITHYARMKKHLFEYHVTDFSDGKYTVTKVTLSIEPLNEAILPIVEKWDKVLKERNTYLHGDRA